MRKLFAILLVALLSLSAIPQGATAAGEVSVVYGDQHSAAHVFGYHYPYPDGNFNSHETTCYSMGFVQVLATGTVNVGGTYQFYTIDDPQDYPNNPSRTVTTNYGNWTFSAGTFYPTENYGVGSPWRHQIVFPANWQNMMDISDHHVPIDHFIFVKKVSTGEMIVNGAWRQWALDSNC